MPPHEALIVKADCLSSEAISRAIAAATSRIGIVWAATAMEGLSFLKKRRFLLAVIGVDLPDMDGLELVRRIIDQRTAVHVMLVVERLDPCTEYLVAQLQVEGLIDARQENEKTLSLAFRRVLAGHRFVSKSCRPRSAHDVEIFRKLTPRELGVLAILGCGSDDTEAATRLSISAHTVHTH